MLACSAAFGMRLLPESQSELDFYASFVRATAFISNAQHVVTLVRKHTLIDRLLAGVGAGAGDEVATHQLSHCLALCDRLGMSRPGRVPHDEGRSLESGAQGTN